MSRRSPIRGLYVITAELADSSELIRRAAAALAGGARVLQYRDKSSDYARRAEEARALAELCARHDACFIVNDDVELAAECGAGVHLGRDDADLAVARRRLGGRAVIGVSCYDSIERAEAAAAAGADYLAFGSFFPSAVKPDAVRPPVSLLGKARRRFDLPLVAIGGINADNAGALVAAGADAVAVISSVFLAEDPRGAAAGIAALFGPGGSSEV